MSKVLIIGAPRHDKALVAALIAQLGKAAEVATVSMNEFGRAMSAIDHQVNVPVMLHPRPDFRLHTSPPKNHPDGWYRQFEKRSKRK